VGKLPSFQFYPGDWLRDSVSGCSLAAQGLWLRMMIIMHDSPEYGYLSDNGEPMKPEVVARRCGCNPEEYEKLLGELLLVNVPRMSKMHIIYSKRMVEDEIRRKNTARRVRKNRELAICNAPVTAMKHRSSSSSSSSKREKKDIGHLDVLDDRFSSFWKAYPRKVAKTIAQKKWIFLKPTQELTQTILADIQRRLDSDEWDITRKEYIPHPATYLSQRRWEDETRTKHDPYSFFNDMTEEEKKGG
jgi:hypothetical protein